MSSLFIIPFTNSGRTILIYVQFLTTFDHQLRSSDVQSQKRHSQRQRGAREAHFRSGPEVVGQTTTIKRHWPRNEMLRTNSVEERGIKGQ